jgi:hypothetical protein
MRISLEHQIRALMEEAKNTTERKKVENVGRPDDDNKDPETSKLAKQGQIKSKIIDEDNLGFESKASKNKPNETDKKDAKEIKGGKTEVDLDPKTDDKVGDESDETDKSNKTRKKANKEIGSKGAGDVKEEVIDEAQMSNGRKQALARKTSHADTGSPTPNHREFAARGLMHHSMAKDMHVGKTGDFYAHGTGDKKYGTVTKNNGKEVHVKQTHDSYAAGKVSKVHKFKVASHIHEETLDEKNWIAGAVKHPGALHKQLHVPAGEKIPAGKLNAAAEKGGKLGQRARLAKTLKRIVKGK